MLLSNTIVRNTTTSHNYYQPSKACFDIKLRDINLYYFSVYEYRGFYKNPHVQVRVI